MDQSRVTLSDVTVIVVDDHDVFRLAAEGLLNRAGFRVIGSARTASAGVALAETLHPDLVLLDVRLPDRSGFDVASTLAALTPRPDVVLVSSLSRDEVLPRMDPGLVRGFVPKPELTAEKIRDLLGVVT